MRRAASDSDIFSNIRHDVWDGFLNNMETSLQADASNTGHMERSSVMATTSAMNAETNNYFSVLHAPGLSMHSEEAMCNAMRSPNPQQTLRDWIAFHKQNMRDTSERRRYYERCVRLLNSLVLKIIVNVMKQDKSGVEMEVAFPPRLMTVDNIIVRQSDVEGEAAFFVRNETVQDSKNMRDNKYAAMKALGCVAYQLLTRGHGPPISSLLCSMADSDRLSLSLDDHNGAPDRQLDRAKRQRAQQTGGITTAMLSAGVPYPLCRFTIDLLGGEDGQLFRSDNSFESFNDVLTDLNQMMDNPDAFIHQSVEDQWNLAISDKLHGRESEMNIIMDVAAKVSGSFTKSDALFEALTLSLPKKQHILLVTGKPGSGKSRLVRETILRLENQGWVCLECKFETIVHAEPLSIMAEAFDSFLVRSDIKICNHISKSMQPADIMLLAKHVPCLLKCLETPMSPVGDFEVTKEQMHQLFCQLLESISSLYPVVFFVDDLQWVDAASMDLLLALIRASGAGVCNSKKSNVLFVGAYRDNELDNNLELIQMLRNTSNKSCQVTYVPLHGFGINTLNQIVSMSLCLPLRRTKSLSEIILLKTDGIVIHMIEFISRLIGEKVLSRSLLKGWEWDCEKIECCTISHSVAELFTLKMNSLQDEAITSLQVCSIFGSRIDTIIINLIQGYDGDPSVDLNAGVKAAVGLGLVEKTGSPTVFKFAHDIILQAAFDMIPPNNRSSMLQKLATTLIKNATAANVFESIIFVAVDLINRVENCKVIDQNQRLLYASMNDRAAKKALAVPDFLSAKKYAETGLKFLDRNHWITEHNLSMGLYSSSVSALYSCSHSDRDVLKQRINTVFKHAKDVEEEFKTRYIYIQLLGETSLQAAIDECHKLLSRLGEPINSSCYDKIEVRSELERVKEAVFADGYHISMMNKMEDSKKIRAMQVMRVLSGYYHYKRSFVIGLVSAKMVELSMNFGYSEDTSFALAVLAFQIVSVLGDIDQGCSCARLALTLVSRTRHNLQLPFVYVVVYGLVLIFVEPIQATLEPLLISSQQGFKNGSIAIATRSIQVYVVRSYLSGKKVSVMIDEIEMLARKCAQHGQIHIIQTYLTSIYNVLLDLADLPNQTLEPMVHFDSDNQKPNHEEIGSEVKLICAISHSIYTRELTRAQEVYKLFADTQNADSPTVYNHIILQFYAGLTAYYLRRQTNDPIYEEHAEYFCKGVESALVHSSWNFENKHLLLKAECHYTRGEISEAAQRYKESIISAKNHKFPHEKALSCECAGYFYNEQGDEEKAEEMFEQAILAYTEWGAVKKVQALKDRISSIRKKKSSLSAI